MQRSCIINTFHIESLPRSSLSMSRQLSLGARARALRHNHCLDYISGGYPLYERHKTLGGGLDVSGDSRPTFSSRSR
jgi:hypothetical protein